MNYFLEHEIQKAKIKMYKEYQKKEKFRNNLILKKVIHIMKSLVIIEIYMAITQF